jgi:ferredoxin
MACVTVCPTKAIKVEESNIFYSLRYKKVSKILEESDAILSEVARMIYECVSPRIDDNKVREKT